MTMLLLLLPPPLLLLLLLTMMANAHPTPSRHRTASGKLARCS